jgi:putative ABC transport system substrate-binding protein
MALKRSKKACGASATALARMSSSSTASPTPRSNGRPRLRQTWSGSVWTSSSPGSITVAAMKATTTIPIVMTTGIDPVDAGLVSSQARPGGNVTGLAVDSGGEILGKRFELLKETLPNLLRLGFMFNPDVALNRSRQASITETARALGLTLVAVEVRGLDALEQAFATMVRERAQAFVLQGDSVLLNYRGQIAEMALQKWL